MFDWVLNTPLCNINKPRLHHAVSLEKFFGELQKIDEQLLLKEIEKLEALSEIVQKIYDLKKTSVAKIHRGICRYYQKHQ